MSEENININTNEDKAEEQEVKTYTLEEVQNLIQSEADKRVTQALKTQKATFDKELNKQKSLSELDGEARNLKEKELQIQELEDKLKNYAILENKNEIQKTLGARGLNTAFADIITIGDDLEEAQSRIETLDKLFKQAVQKEVKARLGESSSNINTGNSIDNLTKEDFMKMTLAQQADLYKNNPELYEKLAN